MTTQRRALTLAAIGLAGIVAYIGLMTKLPQTGSNLQQFLGLDRI